MSHIVLGIDPGTQRTACVALTPIPQNRLRVVRADMVPSDCEALRQWLTAMAVRGAAAVGLEWVQGAVFQAFRAAPLLASQGVAGEVSGLAFALGVPVHKVPAATWRKAVIGTLKRGPRVPGVKRPAAPWDALVERAMPLFVEGAAGLNEHLLDACGVGLWCSRTVWRRTS